jgi:MtrB/PioB family decaheme-associated outer membrane protein
MMRATRLAVLLASGVVFLNAQAFAQTGPTAAPIAADTATAAAPVAAAPVTAAAPAPDADAQDKDKEKAADSQFDFQTGDVVIDAIGRPDVESSKFEEYRVVPKGISMPAFRLFGRDNQIRFDLRGEHVGQLDERYTGYLKTDWFAMNADYNSIVHNIGNNGRTFLIQQAPGEWRMSNTLQQAIQNIWESTPTAQRNFNTFVLPLFSPSINEGSTVDVQVVRERTDITADLARNQPFSLKVNYQREQRHGSGGLSSNYLNYQTETPQVTEYLTQDYGLAGSLDKKWGNLRGALHYNTFEDQAKTLMFDSPFRATDALAVTVGTGTAATAVGGPTQGRMINPPDNQAYLGTFGTTIKLAHNTRITGDVNMSHMTQNDQFFPYMTNTAVVTPVNASQVSSLPAQSLNGVINTTGIVFAITSKPTEALNFAIRYRRYDLDNQTPRITFPGYGSWDRTWSSSSRISVPYAFTNSRFDATVGYDVGKVTFEGGYRRATIDRTYRETEQTNEDTLTAAVVYHAMDNQANLRVMYENGTRDYSGLELARSEDASFPVPPTGLSANALGRDGSLRFDQSKRDSNRFGIVADVSPVPNTTLAFTYLHNKDVYNETVYGLQNANYDTYTGEATYSPGDKWNVTGYYTHEKNGSAQINNGTSNFPAIDIFTINLADDVDTAGFGSQFQLVPNKATLNFSGQYQNLKGTAGFITDPASTYQKARAAYGGVQDIPNADNARLTRVDLSVDCTLTRKVTLTFGTWYEDYLFSDVDSQGLQNVYPGAFFLALNDGSYNATVGYVRLTYHW